jgi:acyl-CoA reductase-like NAD-dependent aldehyde dehydrogenase
VRDQLFIGNEWRSSATGATFDVINPATEEVLAAVPEAAAADVDAAVAAARACFESAAWRGLSPRKRGGLLYRAGELLEARRDEVAALET